MPNQTSDQMLASQLSQLQAERMGLEQQLATMQPQVDTARAAATQPMAEPTWGDIIAQALAVGIPTVAAGLGGGFKNAGTAAGGAAAGWELGEKQKREDWKTNQAVRALEFQTLNEQLKELRGERQSLSKDVLNIGLTQASMEERREAEGRRLRDEKQLIDYRTDAEIRKVNNRPADIPEELAKITARQYEIVFGEQIDPSSLQHKEAYAAIKKLLEDSRNTMQDRKLEIQKDNSQIISQLKLLEGEGDEQTAAAKEMLLQKYEQNEKDISYLSADPKKKGGVTGALGTIYKDTTVAAEKARSIFKETVRRVEKGKPAVGLVFPVSTIMSAPAETNVRTAMKAWQGLPTVEQKIDELKALTVEYSKKNVAGTLRDQYFPSKDMEIIQQKTIDVLQAIIPLSSLISSRGATDADARLLISTILPASAAAQFNKDYAKNPQSTLEKAADATRTIRWTAKEYESFFEKMKQNLRDGVLSTIKQNGGSLEESDDSIYKSEQEIMGQARRNFQDVDAETWSGGSSDAVYQQLDGQ